MSGAAPVERGERRKAGVKMLVYQVMAAWNPGGEASRRARTVRSWLEGSGVASRICVEEYREEHAALGLESAERIPRSSSGNTAIVLHRDCMPRRARRYLRRKDGKLLLYGTASGGASRPGGCGGKAATGEEAAEIIARSRGELRVVVHSQRTKSELAGAGFDQERIEVIPVVAEWERLTEVPGDRRMREYLGDGTTNMVYCGEVAPQNRLEDLLDIFLAYHRLINAASRLVVCGRPRLGYLRSFQAAIVERGIVDAVLLLSASRPAEKAACLETAHFFVQPGGGEEAFVEMATAIRYAVPVVARENGYLEGFLDGSGILYGDEDPVLVAELLENVRTDRLLRERILLSQERRYAEVSEKEMRERFREAVRRIGVD